MECKTLDPFSNRLQQDEDLQLLFYLENQSRKGRTVTIFYKR